MSSPLGWVLGSDGSRATGEQGLRKYGVNSLGVALKARNIPGAIR